MSACDLFWPEDPMPVPSTDLPLPARPARTIERAPKKRRAAGPQTKRYWTFSRQHQARRLLEQIGRARCSCVRGSGECRSCRARRIVKP